MRFGLLITAIVAAISTLAAHADASTYTNTGRDFTAPNTTIDFVRDHSPLQRRSILGHQKAA